MSIVKKKFPEDYPTEYLKVIDMLATDLKNVTVEGSYSIVGLKYPGDVDCYDTMDYDMSEEKAFSEIENFFSERVAAIQKTRAVIITKMMFGSYEDGEPIYWTPNEVKQGYQGGVRDRIFLYEAIQGESLLKIDVTSYIGGVYIAFSMTYIITVNGKPINEFVHFDKSSLESDIIKYKDEGKYYKMAKRSLALALEESNGKITKDIELYIEFFNSDFGAIAQMYSNIEVLISLIETRKVLSFVNIGKEIDGFIGRMNVLSNYPIFNSRHSTEILRNAEQEGTRPGLLKDLGKLAELFSKGMNKSAQRFLQANKLL